MLKALIVHDFYEFCMMANYLLHRIARKRAPGGRELDGNPHDVYRPG
jgi:hypothetical protein